MQKRTTLKNIADILNVSITTVNRGLKGHPDISTKLKEQILELAERLHYRPNFFASNLRKGHSGIIGVLIPKIIHYNSSTIISGIIKKAAEFNYQVIIAETHNDPDREIVSLQNMMNSGVDGLLIAVCNKTVNEDHFEEIKKEDIPLIFFDKVPEHINGPKVLVNDYKGAFLATRHLIQEGYQRIAHIKGQTGSRNSLPRYNGYLDALAKGDIAFDEKYVKTCVSATEEEGYKFAKEFMKMSNPPDAIFTVNDETAIGVLAALRKLGIAVPTEVGVVGFCNTPTGNYIQPTLSSVNQYGFEVGQKSAEWLIELINKENSEDQIEKSIILEPKLVIRESSKRIVS